MEEAETTLCPPISRQGRPFRLSLARRDGKHILVSSLVSKRHSSLGNLPLLGIFPSQAFSIPRRVPCGSESRDQTLSSHLLPSVQPRLVCPQHLSQGFFMSDAPKSLAQPCHLQESALAFLPLLKKGGGLFRPFCALPGGIPCPTSYPPRPPCSLGHKPVPAVPSSDQSRVLTTPVSPTSPPQPFCCLKGYAGGELLETFIRLLQKLFFLKTDPVFVALTLHSGKAVPLLGE